MDALVDVGEDRTRRFDIDFEKGIPGAAGTELGKIMLGTFLERRDRPRDQTKA